MDEKAFALLSMAIRDAMNVGNSEYVLREDHLRKRLKENRLRAPKRRSAEPKPRSPSAPN